MDLPESIRNLVVQFNRLPSIGEKSATRLVLNLVQWHQQELGVFSKAIEELGKLKKCESCRTWSDEYKCEICSHPSRSEAKAICVVESINDLMAIERSGHYKGLYHVLGGVLNPLLGIGPEELELNLLFSRIQSLGITNIILAVNPSVEGDATCSFIKDQINDLSVEVERIGFGIPMGGSLEYVDSMTISKALENRKGF